MFRSDQAHMNGIDNYTIGLATRKWLGEQAAGGLVLDQPCRILIERIVEKCLDVNPGGMVYRLAVGEGADQDSAKAAGSVCELFYAGCSVTDDLQDGDTDVYLEDVPMALRLNGQLQLISLVEVRLDGMAIGDKLRDPSRIIGQFYRTLSIMLTGQRMELVRDPWNEETWYNVARLSAGEQFAAYFSLVAAVSGRDRDSWGNVGRAYGIALQMVADIESEDCRLLCLDAEKMSDIRQKVIRELRESISRIEATGPVAEYAECLIQRFP